MSPWALDDPDTVDERRRSVGLGPLAETIERFRRQSSRDQCPADLEAYREEMLDWARSVGWL